MSTQMTGIGVYVSNMADKLLVPGKYTTAAEHQTNILEHVSYNMPLGKRREKPRQRTRQRPFRNVQSIGLVRSPKTRIRLPSGHENHKDSDDWNNFLLHGNFLFQQIIVIQKYLRRWLAMRAVSRVREDRDARAAWENEAEDRKRAEKDARIQREYARRMNPKSREDFDLLYNALESA